MPLLYGLLLMPHFIYRHKIDLLSVHRSNPQRYPFLLGSESISNLSRYSLLLAFPGKVIRTEHGDKSFTQQLDQCFAQRAEQELTGADQGLEHLPFRGGWFVYLGYELAAELEPTLQLPQDAFDLPVAIAVDIPAAIIVDHVESTTTVFVESDAYQVELEQILQDISQLESDVSEPAVDNSSASTMIACQQLIEDPEARYLSGVAKIADYIAAGDVFQVNVSRAWQAEVDSALTAADMYHVLSNKNPAPFAVLADFGDFSIVSSSPERLVCVGDGWAETRPIAGTRPRSENDEKDRALMEELIRHPKEQAEHIMLLDLERNDLGRICIPGTVEVNELMVVETYTHVHHIVSNVRGRIRPEITPGQVIRATFPGGTITGCPKVRCMEIIAELEQIGRGPYTGSVGYINRNGEMDLNILIRTLVKKEGKINFRTGAGIVFDSIPEKEVDETRHKAKGLLKAFSLDD